MEVDCSATFNGRLICDVDNTTLTSSGHNRYRSSVYCYLRRQCGGGCGAAGFVLRCVRNTSSDDTSQNAVHFYGMFSSRRRAMYDPAPPDSGGGRMRLRRTEGVRYNSSDLFAKQATTVHA